MKRKITFLVMVLCIVLVGCSTKFPSQYNLGIIYTMEYEKNSLIKFYNDFQEETCLSYKYSSMSYDGYRNSLIQDGKLYLLPLGRGDKLDYGKVISYALDSGSIVEYDFNRTNITDYDVKDNHIYVTSNINGISYIDKYDMTTGNIISIESEDGIIFDSVVECNNKIFCNIIDMNEENIQLCEVDFDKQDYNIVYDYIGEVSSIYLVSYDEENKIYFIDDQMLIEYDILNSVTFQYETMHNNAFNLSVIDDQLYIGCTDLFEDVDSCIDVFDLKEKKFVRTIEYDGIILQIEVKNDVMYILDYNKLVMLDLNDENDKMIRTMELGKDAYYIGGFFVK